MTHPAITQAARLLNKLGYTEAAYELESMTQPVIAPPQLDATELLARLAAAEADAARYQHLKRNASQKTAYDVYGNGGCWMMSIFSANNSLSFDKAVDAVMKGKQ